MAGGSRYGSVFHEGEQRVEDHEGDGSGSSLRGGPCRLKALLYVLRHCRVSLLLNQWRRPHVKRLLRLPILDVGVVISFRLIVPIVLGF